jgi:hypothetical protein
MTLEVAKTVRAKFLCVEKGEAGYSSQYKTSKLVLVPVTSTSEENKKFFAATPIGKLELGIVNPSAAAQFEVGKEYFVDFTNPDDYKMVEATAEALKPVLSEQELITILAKNNKQVAEAFKRQDEAKKSNCPVTVEDAASAIDIENSQALLLLKLMRYLRGEIKIDEIA